MTWPDYPASPPPLLDLIRLTLIFTDWRTQEMATMRAVQVSAPKADFQLVERPIPEPAAGEVRIKMEACGICRGDSLVKEGNWPGIQYPRVPGHEVAGVIDKVGPDVPRWKQGQRVGVGWYAGHCGYCDECRHGHILSCST